MDNFALISTSNSPSFSIPRLIFLDFISIIGCEWMYLSYADGRASFSSSPQSEAEEIILICHFITLENGISRKLTPFSILFQVPLPTFGSIFSSKIIFPQSPTI